MKNPLPILYILAVLLSASTEGWCADFQKGWDAFNNEDYTAAFQEWKPLAEQGDAKARFLVGMMYSDGTGVPPDYKEAITWYRLAAEQGYALAQNNLGLMYYEGQGVAQDYTLARKWLQLSAGQGVPEAQFLLGWMYYKGQGVPRDYKEASQWLRLAADQGLAVAQTNLGLMFLRGHKAFLKTLQGSVQVVQACCRTGGRYCANESGFDVLQRTWRSSRL